MYRGLKITPPFFEIGPKAYLYGTEVLKLARHADKVGKKYAVQIIITLNTLIFRYLHVRWRMFWYLPSTWIRWKWVEVLVLFCLRRLKPLAPLGFC